MLSADVACPTPRWAVTSARFELATKPLGAIGGPQRLPTCENVVQVAIGSGGNGTIFEPHYTALHQVGRLAWMGQLSQSAD